MPHPYPSSAMYPPLACVAELLAGATCHVTLHEGRSLRWHEWGTGQPLLLLHGGSGAWTHWVRNISRLVGAGYRMFAPDIPGFGASDVAATDGDDAPGTVTPLLAGKEALIGRACPVVGFSFGAMVAVLMASCEVPIGCIRCSSGLGLRDWKSPNTQSTQESQPDEHP